MARILLALVFGVWLVSADQEVEGGKCERIKLPLCQDVGYNWTAMPNLMGHNDQKEAEEAVSLILFQLMYFFVNNIAISKKNY